MLLAAMPRSAASAAPRRPARAAASSCLPDGVAARVEPDGPGTITVNVQGLRPHERVDVLLNTEAGALLLARPTTSSVGKLCHETIRIPSRFTIPDRRVPGGHVTVPLHDDDAVEEYQLSVISEGHGDGVSFELAFRDGVAQRPVQLGLFNVNRVADGATCPKLTPPHRAALHVATPLSTDGRWIVDRHGHRVKLASVNWYGAEESDFVPGGLYCQTAAAIAKQIRADGFNSVRLPWSNAMLEEDPRGCATAAIGQPCVPPGLLAANPDLRGDDALGVYRAVVHALAEQGILVILDDHTTDAEFCCAPGVFDGIWWGGQLWDDATGAGAAHWVERQQWFEADWADLARSFVDVPQVVGADLRNEPSGGYGHHASWQGTRVGADCRTTTGPDVATPGNWEQAAQETGTVVLDANPHLLVIVEGVDSGTNLSDVWAGDSGRGLPLSLCDDGKPVKQLVYSAHDYQWDVNSTTYATLSTFVDAHWGGVLAQGPSTIAPVWVGEFGGCDTSPFCTTPHPIDCPTGPDRACIGNFFVYFTQYLAQHDLDWSYWALNGTRSEGGANVSPDRATRKNLLLRTTWTWFQPSIRGILDHRWHNDRASGPAGLLPRLQCIQGPTQGPLGPHRPAAAPVSAACAPAPGP